MKSTLVMLLPALIGASSVSAQISRAVPPVDEERASQLEDDSAISDESIAPRHASKAAAFKLRYAHMPRAGGETIGFKGISRGELVVVASARRLYWGVDNNVARAFPVAVGKSGKAWSGVVRVGFKTHDPAWHPSKAQRIAHRVPAYVGPGRSNPLGPRALYLFKGGHDTLFRIHGTNDSRSIGHAVSGGCIRMRNADIVDLYDEVPVGTRVTVR